MTPPSGLNVAAVGLIGCMALALATPERPPRVLFNTTLSAPIGFYLVSPGRYRVGDLVAVAPPPALARWLAARRYLPANVPLLKRVAAVEGQLVCGKDGDLSIDGRWVARAKPSDRWGRPLPRFSECRRLIDDEVFFVNADAPTSLDSRYFGPLPARGVIGAARPVWTWGVGQ